MSAEVADACVVLNGVVLVEVLVHADAVLDDELRHAVVALVKALEHDAQTHRVDGPAPIGSAEVGVGHVVRVVGARGLGDVDLNGGVDHARGVVAKADVVHRTRLESSEVLVGDVEIPALALEHLERVVGIDAAALHVAEEEDVVVGVVGQQHVLGAALARVGGARGDHAADLEARVDLVTSHDGLGARHKLVVRALVHHLLGVIELGEDHARVGPAKDGVGDVELVANLVEGHPVLDLLVIALEANAGVTHKEVDELAVCPAAVLDAQAVGHLEVRQCDDRLDAMLQHAVEHVVIELEAGLVGLELVALGEDAAPADGRAEALEAHLGQKRDVLGVGVIEVDALVVGVVLALNHTVGDLARHAVGAAGHDVGDRQAAAVLSIAALELMRCYRAAPQKVFR